MKKRGIFQVLLSFVAVVSILLLFDSCRKELKISSSVNSDDREIKIVTEVIGRERTRSPKLDANGAGHFSDGDVISLLVKSGEQSQLIRDYRINHTVLRWGDLDKIKKGSTVTFTASSRSIDGLQPVHATAEAGAGNANELFLGSSSAVAWGSTSPVKLTFRHVLHKLVVELYSSDRSYTEEELSGFPVTCSALSDYNIHLAEGRVETISDGSVLHYSGASTHNQFYIPPQPSAGVGLTLTVNGEEFHYSLPTKTASGTPLNFLEGGKRLTIRLDVQRSSTLPPVLTVGDFTILGWEDQGVIEGVIGE